MLAAATIKSAQELKEMRGPPGDQYPLESSEGFAKRDRTTAALHRSFAISKAALVRSR